MQIETNIQSTACTRYQQSHSILGAGEIVFTARFDILMLCYYFEFQSN